MVSPRRHRLTGKRRSEAGIVAYHLRIVGSIEDIAAGAGDTDRPLRKHDVLLGINFYDLHVELITDQLLPFLRRTARVGRGFETLPGRLLV